MEDNRNQNNTDAKVTKTVNLSIKKNVLLPPWILLVVMVVFSLANGELFMASLNQTTSWILDNFAWAFNLTTFICVLVVARVYFSPFANVRIGGRNAKPMMKMGNLVWITLCTTIAAGILFWACAEPIYQMYAPSISDGAEPGSTEAAIFSMKAMYLEWTWSPYAIYTSATIVFAFVFYNMKKPYSIASALIPALGERVNKYGDLINVICLLTLVTGMAASLGTGAMTIAGGMEQIFGIKSNSITWGVVIAVIVITFVISSISGVMKGIKVLSDINAKVYLVLLAFVLIFGPTNFMLNFSVESWGEYARDFLPLSLTTGEIFNDSWAKSWPIFYWCNWLSWAPITAAFLGRILVGYTVKDAIRCNLIIPAIFATVWMGLFSTAAIYYEMNGFGFYELLQTSGPEAIVYAVFRQFPLSLVIIVFYLFIVFISLVTASDSNTTVIAELCTHEDATDHAKATSMMKILWGTTIAIITWVLISFAGIDGIKAASNLGGFPNMFLMILILCSLIKICNNPKKYDIFKEDYDSNGIPLLSERQKIEENA